MKNLSFLIFFVIVCNVAFSQTTTVYDTTSTSIESDSTLDSIIVIHQQTVIKKQIVVENQEATDELLQHSISFFFSVPEIWNNTNKYTYSDSTTQYKVAVLPIKRYRIVYNKMMNKNWLVGAGIGIKNIRFKINSNTLVTKYRPYTEKSVDTLDVYYIENNGIKVPFYITQDVDIQKTDTITYRTIRDTITKLLYFTIPLQLQFIQPFNEYFYFGLSIVLEPGIICYKKGIIVSEKGFLEVSKQNIRSFSFDSQLGLKSGLLLTQNISLEAMLFYNFSVQQISKDLPQSFIRNQLQVNFGLSYSF